MRVVVVDFVVRVMRLKVGVGIGVGVTCIVSRVMVGVLMMMRVLRIVEVA